MNDEKRRINMNTRFVKFMLLIMVTILIFVVADTGIAETIFLPLVLEDADSAAPYPTGALFVFSTVATTDGDVGGREGMSAMCSEEDFQAHFCTIQEIENAFATKGVYFIKPFANSWVDDPLTSSWNSITENCNGWTQTVNVNGREIYATAYKKGITPCNALLSIACCKWIP